MDRLPSRTELNKKLYNSYENQSYDRFDVNSNQEVLKDDVRKIDVNQIRDILDKKYRDDAPKRKSIQIVEPDIDELEREDTKEYDLREILNRAKQDVSYDYDREKLNKASDVNQIVNDVRKKYSFKDDNEENSEELMELIKTVTQLEIQNSNKDAELLGLSDTVSLDPDKIIKKSDEEDFYTGKLAVTEKDFEDFSDIENDIKSNSIFIKLLVFIFILVAIGIGIFIANNFFDLGLF